MVKVVRARKFCYVPRTNKRMSHLRTLEGGVHARQDAHEGSHQHKAHHLYVTSVSPILATKERTSR